MYKKQILSDVEIYRKRHMHLLIIQEIWAKTLKNTFFVGHAA